MTVIEFLVAHPWWTTLWLAMICSAFAGAFHRD